MEAIAIRLSMDNVNGGLSSTLTSQSTSGFSITKAGRLAELSQFYSSPQQNLSLCQIH
jgi:hypothetical protein